VKADPKTEAAVMNVVKQCFEAFTKRDLDSCLVSFAPDPDVVVIGTGGDEKCIGLADIFWFGDDFATARGMMMSPEHWRKFLKPTYRKIFQLAKSHDRKMWFHCCGTFREVMPDLIDMGMDVWETTQVHLPGNEPEVLKKEYGKDICFYGAINTQQTLPFGTPDEVRAEVRERIRVLGKGGGYIVGGDHAILPDVPIENVLAMIDEAKNTSP